MVEGIEWPWLVALSLLLLLCLHLAHKLLDFLWWRPKRLEGFFAKQGIRGSPYRFFLGNVREMIELMLEASKKPVIPPCSHNILPRVLAFYPHWKKIYGTTFLVWFGPKARINVADPDLIREVLVSKSHWYERYESHPLVRQLEGEGLMSLTGEKWAHHRKLIAPTFHMENLKMLVPDISHMVLEMLERWSSATSTSGEVEVDVSDWYQSLAEEAVARTAFGATSAEEGKAIFKLQAKQMVFAAEAFRNVLLPGYRFLPTKKNMEYWRLDRQVRRSLLSLIQRRRKIKIPVDDDGPAAVDLLDLLIKASAAQQNNAFASPNSNRMIIATTPDDIVGECKTFFFAGKQTTSNLMTWATVLLAMHPEWQHRARDEVITLCGGSRHAPSKDHVNKLKTLGMILNETLRLYPPAVATIRRAKSDVELGGRYTVPKDTELLIPIMAVHHDAALWGPDVAEFNPGRFADGVARAARHPTAFMPFGLGPRTCIGQNAALLEAKLTLAIILQRFSFRLSPSYVHAPTVLMLLYPQYGAPIVFTPLPQQASTTC